MSARASIILDHEEPHIQARKKLELFVSPEVADSSVASYSADDPTNGLTKGSKRPSDNALPSFRRYEEPSLLEVFYDLFFAANYTVFSQNQSVVNHESFKAYIGYFSVLWATWFAVTLYDVRYVADSLFERITRATQLGVLVGFAVVAPNFDPDKQTDKRTYKTMMTMSFILCFSRFCLAVEYLAVLTHVRRFRRAQLPLVTQAAINATAGAIFLGIAFRFEPGRKSRVFMTWYLVSAAEAIITVVVSNFSRVLGFTRTHLMKRMSLLTIMILGDGIIAVAQDVVIIVKTPDAWNAQIIGIVTAATATIYFVFLVYHDWMHHAYLPAIRQQIWTLLHFPFHLSLILFMQGFTQFIIWTKAMSLFTSINDKWLGGSNDDDSGANIDWSLVTSQDVASGYANATDAFFKAYPPKWYVAWETVDYAINNITALPDDLWAQLVKYTDTGDENAISTKNWPDAYKYWDAFNAIVNTMANACFQALNLDLTTELSKKYPNQASDFEDGQFQVTVAENTLQRYHLVFAYTYVAAGCALLLLTILSITTRTSRWTVWPIARTAMNLTLSVGVACTATLFLNEKRTSAFLETSWPLPIITIVWLTISITTHIRGGMANKLRRGKTYIQKKRGKYAAVDVPMMQWPEGPGEAAGKDNISPGSEVHRTLSRPASLHNQPAQQAMPYSYGGYAPPGGEGYMYSTAHYGEPPQSGTPPIQPVPYDPTQTSTSYHGAHGTYQ